MIVRLLSAALALSLGAVSGAGSAGLNEGRELFGHLDAASAARVVRSPAHLRSAKSEAQLGFQYEHGLGVPQSFDLAFELYVSAAERGDPTGQYLLGLMYDKGHGVAPDGILAHKWLNLAAAGANRRYREYYLRLRDAAATKLTLDQLIVAQRLALEWAPKGVVARAER
jgi:TPR repeat protein